MPMYSRHCACQMDSAQLQHVVAGLVEGARIADSSHSGSLLGLSVINRLLKMGYQPVAELQIPQTETCPHFSWRDRLQLSAEARLL